MEEENEEDEVNKEERGHLRGTTQTGLRGNKGTCTYSCPQVNVPELACLLFPDESDSASGTRSGQKTRSYPSVSELAAVSSPDDFRSNYYLDYDYYL